jgi:dTDP-4-dehydrorhamnose 3,5-epimerase
MRRASWCGWRRVKCLKWQSESAEFLHNTTDYWYQEFERSLLWNNPALGIRWPLAGEPLLATKDMAGKHLNEAEVF